MPVLNETFPYSGQPFEGIIADLIRRGGNTNPDTSGLVKATASSTRGTYPRDVMDYAYPMNYFYTRNEPNSWIQLDMKDRQVSLTHYTLQSNDKGMGFLQHWAIEGSNDMAEWTVIDERHTDDLVGDDKLKTFPVNCNGVFYRYIRLRQLGKNSNGYDILTFRQIELFGQVMK